MQEEYQPKLIEPEIQKFWQEHTSFKVTEDLNKEKFYCLSMFPYPSGSLHVGHVRNYVLGDVIARYQRMLGKNVLHPIGWDAFGLPAENAAIKQGIAPAKWTYANIDHMRAQLKKLGLSFDWSREIATCQPEYYRWEQWLFVQLYKKGLVYKKNALVNWDPVDQTVLANEQVIQGRGWRSGALIERKEIPQWFFKITAYAEELLTDLGNLVHWPDEVKTMQRNWIGRSSGCTIQFSLDHPHFPSLEVFTTRPDTLYGVSFLAVSPQHPLAQTAANQHLAIAQFIESFQATPVAEAATATLEKQGVASGFTARHPLTEQPIPIWIANYVRSDYGCGAVMGVPAHDERDFEFAQQYQLPIQPVLEPLTDQTSEHPTYPFTESGRLIHSGPFTGLTSAQAHSAIEAALVEKGLGEPKIQYRLRDWGVSRQRYWGTPIPMIYCEDCGAVPVPEKDLPVVLPEEMIITGQGSPLKNCPEFYTVACPQCQKSARRETDTFDTFVESSWYYARFACPSQQNSMLDDRAKYWTPVDQYIGGIEHAVLHLLYARFFHKVLRDLGLVNSNEPFTRGAKMSKSKGNTVDPEALIQTYGSDTLRLFVLFAAPPEQSLEWSESGVEGAHRFLKRLWSFAYHHPWLRELNETGTKNLNPIDWSQLSTTQRQLRRQVYEILQSAKNDYERQQFNTVVASCMKLLNLLQSASQTLATEPESDKISLKWIMQQGLSILLRLLAPIVPHITQVLWQELGFAGLILKATWPKVAADALTVEKIDWVIQVNGKLRGHLSLDPDLEDAVIKSSVLNHVQVKRYTENQSIKKVIIVPKKLVNVVI
ncbi:leucine--tRNA ligase [Rickettsiella massiliensis]|uniref:leucine--tRNA ligase n=1 Tax=Rickettsiella massiliensis TaxID=676517 RepID=UPI00029ACCA2|nr:leucine--tRNA ligase [Rickettsiella massiliensis]